MEYCNCCLQPVTTSCCEQRTSTLCSRISARPTCMPDHSHHELGHDHGPVDKDAETLRRLAAMRSTEYQRATHGGSSPLRQPTQGGSSSLLPQPSPQPSLADIVENLTRSAETCLKMKDYAGAVREGSCGLDILPKLANLSIVCGRALLSPILDQVKNVEPCQRTWVLEGGVPDDFKGAYDAFHLALKLDGNNQEARMELKRLEELLRVMMSDRQQALEHAQELLEAMERAREEEVLEALEHAHEHHHEQSHVNEPADKPPPNTGTSEADVYDRTLSAVERKRRELMRAKAKECERDCMVDVIIVGAGAAGIGTAFTLTHVFGLDPSRVLLLERGEAIGETFRRWPQEMRFISPSFNQQGWTNSFDLNSVAYGTSPAYTLHSQHPSGAQYAKYLQQLSAAVPGRV